MTVGTVHRFSSVSALNAGASFGPIPENGRVLVVSSGVRGLAVLAERFAAIAAESGAEVVVVASHPGVVKARPLRPPRANVSLLDQVRHRRRWRRNGAGVELVRTIDSFSGVFVAGTGPALATIKHIAPTGVPTAVTIDVTMERHAEQNGWRRNRLFHNEVRHEAECFSRVDRLITISEWCRSSTIDDLGIDPANVETLLLKLRPSEAVNALVPRPSTGPIRLVAIGSPWIRKGMDRTIAWLERRPTLDVELHLFGDAPPHIDDPRIKAHGRVDGGALIREHLPTFDLLVHPTRRDQSANVVVEAAWSGVASLASSIAGIPELIDVGVTGWLLEDQSEAVLERHLDALVGDRPALARAGAAARQKAEREFDADRTFGPYAAWLAGHGPAPKQELTE